MDVNFERVVKVFKSIKHISSIFIPDPKISK